MYLITNNNISFSAETPQDSLTYPYKSGVFFIIPDGYTLTDISNVVFYRETDGIVSNESEKLVRKLCP